MLANDSDPDGNALSVTSTGLLATAELGSVAMGADGSFTYTAPAGFHGSDSFAYSVTDGQGGAASAIANIDVLKVNATPTPVTTTRPPMRTTPSSWTCWPMTATRMATR